MEWIRRHEGRIVFITDSDILYLRPFLAVLEAELGDADLALSMERPEEEYNIGQMEIRCSEAVARFFEGVGRELERGAWDQEAVNRLLPGSGLAVRMLSRRFANTAVWEGLGPEEKRQLLSYHATGTDPRDGKSSLELKQECFDRVLAEWRELNAAEAAVAAALR